MARRAFVVVNLLVAAASAAAWAKAPVRASETRDPRAEQVVRGMSDYLAGLQSFRVHTVAVDEVVLTGGGKLQLIGTSVTSVNRPNALHSERRGGSGEMALWYDGKTATLLCKATNRYATVPVPAGNLDEAIDTLRKKHGLDAPGADLLYRNPYAILTENMQSSRYIGREDIGGVAVHHVLFQGKEVDFQLWVQDGPQPLPVRYVITTKTMPSQPQFTVTMTKWTPQAHLGAEEFTFRPPSGATEIARLPVDCATPQAR